MHVCTLTAIEVCGHAAGRGVILDVLLVSWTIESVCHSGLVMTPCQHSCRTLDPIVADKNCPRQFKERQVFLDVDWDVGCETGRACRNSDGQHHITCFVVRLYLLRCSDLYKLTLIHRACVGKIDHEPSPAYSVEPRERIICLYNQRYNVAVARQYAHLSLNN